MVRVVSAVGVLALATSFVAAQNSTPASSSASQPSIDPAHNKTLIVASNFTRTGEADPGVIPALPLAAIAAAYSIQPVTPALEPVTPALPDAPSAYRPLSGRDKFEIFLHRTYSPYTMSSAVYEASWGQLWGQWHQYGGGMAGWGKRLGATLADAESRRFIQGFLLSSMLHQDPRYFSAPAGGLIARAWYAGTRVFITRNDSSNATFNSSEMLGTLFTSSLQNAYYPRSDRSLGDTLTRFAGALSSDATSNLIREFEPDLKRLFRKHEPDSMKRLENKIPRSIERMAGQ